MTATMPAGPNRWLVLFLIFAVAFMLLMLV
jgi:hypothetical protein